MTIKAGFPPMTRDNTVLIIVDMQKDFLDDGAACFIPGGRSVVPATAKLLQQFRAAAMPVIHVITVWQKDGVDMSKFTTSEILMERGLREGEPGIDPVEELTPLENEYIVRKKRYSAFYATDLEALLRALGSVYLVTAGVATNYCVRSTVHDAAFRDFMPVVASDCATSYTPEEHDQSLKDIATGFGWVKTNDELASLLRLDDVDGEASHRSGDLVGVAEEDARD
jgi:ureidoacrylate peracid hydrolase